MVDGTLARQKPNSFAQDQERDLLAHFLCGGTLKPLQMCCVQLVNYLQGTQSAGNHGHGGEGARGGALPPPPTSPPSHTRDMPSWRDPLEDGPPREGQRGNDSPGERWGPEGGGGQGRPWPIIPPHPHPADALRAALAEDQVPALQPRPPLPPSPTYPACCLGATQSCACAGMHTRKFPLPPPPPPPGCSGAMHAGAAMHTRKLQSPLRHDELLARCMLTPSCRCIGYEGHDVGG